MWIMAGDENIDHEDEMQQEDHFYFKQDSREKKKKSEHLSGPCEDFLDTANVDSGMGSSGLTEIILQEPNQEETKNILTVNGKPKSAEMERQKKNRTLPAKSIDDR